MGKFQEYFSFHKLESLWWHLISRLITFFKHNLHFTLLQMASLFKNYTMEEQRLAIRCLLAGVKACKIHVKILKVFRNNCLKCYNIYKWVKQGNLHMVGAKTSYRSKETRFWICKQLKSWSLSEKKHFLKDL